MSNKHYNCVPEPNSFWRGLGGHFDSFTQIMCEFVDNSISNLLLQTSDAKIIKIILKEEPEGVFVCIEDNGSGIEDLGSAFTLGSKENQTSTLNEHGFGLKHALAGANSSNDNWKVLTKQKTTDNYFEVHSPYSFDLEVTDIKSSWIGTVGNAGTVIQFTTNNELFASLNQGRQGRNATKFDTLVDYFIEDLGFIYANILEDQSILISVNGKAVRAIKPSILNTYHGKNGKQQITKDFGRGNLDVQYHLCEVAQPQNPSQKYYRRSERSSGLELRLNGRVVFYNNIKDVWGLSAHHYDYNHFLFQINLISKDGMALPSTRTAKTGIRLDDEVIQNIFKWIRITFPIRQYRLGVNCKTEPQAVKELAKTKHRHLSLLRNDIEIEREFAVFRSLEADKNVLPLSDLVLIEDDKVLSVYEAKKGKAKVQDLYQLIMYWDGLVADGYSINEGILLANSFPESFNNILNMLNNKLDIQGNPYKISLRTWLEETGTNPFLNE